MKKLILTVFVGFISGLAGFLFGFQYLIKKQSIEKDSQFTNHSINQNSPIYSKSQNTESVSFAGNQSPINNSTDFVFASEVSKSSVVFITTLSQYEFSTGTMFDWFFEPRTSERAGSGSGVIVSEDGYIVTNNHVIESADKIKVTMGKSTLTAKLIGRDPSTDLAVIKIESKNLKPISMGNSNDVLVGEWVLAVGNPFNLTSTVTAGIVSAKGRNINILKDKFPIESFIQTDAAINPGNSGGALVNQKGQLIGINTAILSKTGSYSGYGFAVPVDIVKKVFKDIVEYGEVQKAFTGIDFVDIDMELAQKMNLASQEGVLVGRLQAEGAAEKIGLKEGDVIIRINNISVESKGSIEEYIANLYPGDEINVAIKRDNKTLEKKMILLNSEGKTGVTKRNIFYSTYLDAEFEVVSKVEKDLLRIKEGIKVVKIKRGGIFAQLDIPEGFIITAINRRAIDDPEEFSLIMSTVKGKVEIYGLDENGRKVYYPFFVK